MVQERLTVNPDSLQALIAKAKKTDKDNYLQKINGANVGYSNSASNYYFGGKINIGNFEAGFRTWKTQEGFNYYQDLYAAGTANGSKWTPINSTFYTIYNKQFKNISFSNTSSYVIQGLDNSSDFVSYNSFYGLLNTNSYSSLTLFNLVFPDSLVDGKKQGWQNTYFYYKARQFRNDLKVNYTKNRMSLLSGLDLEVVNCKVITFNTNHLRAHRRKTSPAFHWRRTMVRWLSRIKAETNIILLMLVCIRN